MTFWELYEPLANLIFPIVHYIFGVSRDGCFAVITGFTCGYPTGVKTAKDLFISGKIKYNEYLYLLTFTNNIGLGFLFGFVQNTILNNTVSPLILMLITYIPSILTAMFFKNSRLDSKIQTSNINGNSTNNNSQNFNLNYSNMSKNHIISPINQIITTLATISFYLIVCSIISDYIYCYTPDSFVLKTPLLSLFEITKGFSLLSNTTLQWKLLLVTIGTITGGASITLQSLALTVDKYAKSVYLKGKLISMLFGMCLLTIYLFIQLIFQ
ncbi:MAG: hypothetical protein E7254_03055 [Lachnospiraceae bacterium]|nr:hypothetical protein [Lachnospiraceae bacterium]